LLACARLHGVVRAPDRMYRRAAVLSVLGMTLPSWGCEARLGVGAWNCDDAPLVSVPDGGLLAPAKDLSITSEWTTGFDDGFCGYQRARGYCYSAQDASFSVVESPTNTGRFAAAFSITTDPEKKGLQARCVREGQFPNDAYYSAAFYVPSGTISNGNWNLMHFQGGSESQDLHGLWDVSLRTDKTGTLTPELIGYLGDLLVLAPGVEAPRDAWFSLTVHIQRDAQEQGVVGLYLDGTKIVERTGITTDDSTWGQWYVGNLATDLDPAESTVYVDDVSILQSPPSSN